MSVTAPVFVSGVDTLQRRRDNARLAELEADLMPTLTALKLAHKRTTYVGRKGDLTCWLTDMEIGARKREPCLLLANKTSPLERHVYVPLNHLWLLVDPDIPDDTAQTLHNRTMQQRAVLDMTERLYGFVTQQDTFRVLDALFDFAEDLKNAKPPQGYTLGQWLQALAEDDMVLTHNGQVMNG